MEEQQYEYGMIGLGTMGRNLVFNMCDHGYKVAGFDKDLTKVDALENEKGGHDAYGARTVEDFIKSLKTPRVILLLVPAGPIVDSVVEELKPLLSKFDLIMDCGNSHYTDTNTRIDRLAKDDIHFMGVGISGGEAGARYGPSIMPGGLKEDYKRVDAMLSHVAAKANDEPCVAWLGPGSAGHYVKMVHNGIEYGLMQLLSEVYHLLKYAGMNNEEIQAVFAKWNDGPVSSFLIEITADVLAEKDDLTGRDLVDMILDSAHQKGTGAWTSEDAMGLQVPIPAIDAAVSARNLSAYKDERVIAAQKITGNRKSFTGNKSELIAQLEQALHFAMLTTYAQGMVLLQHASQEYEYGLEPDKIAGIWRGGCIIRAAMLEDIKNAFIKQPDLHNLLLSEFAVKTFSTTDASIRKIIRLGIEGGIPLPGMMASLAYYDAYRSAWLPANLIQAQRDYFGAHTYERTDRPGAFHTNWIQLHEHK